MERSCGRKCKFFSAAMFLLALLVLTCLDFTAAEDTPLVLVKAADPSTQIFPLLFFGASKSSSGQRYICLFPKQSKIWLLNDTPNSLDTDLAFCASVASQKGCAIDYTNLSPAIKAMPLRLWADGTRTILEGNNLLICENPSAEGSECRRMCGV